MKTSIQQLEKDGWRTVGDFADLKICAKGSERRLIDKDGGVVVNYRVDLPKLTEERSLETE